MLNTNEKKLLDFITNPANYEQYIMCYDGNHSWDEDSCVAREEIATIIEAARKDTKYLWWNNRTCEFHFYSCVEVVDFYEDFIEMRVHCEEAIDKMNLAAPSTNLGNGRTLVIRMDFQNQEDDVSWDNIEEAFFGGEV
jgi:hypothetical protein